MKISKALIFLLLLSCISCYQDRYEVNEEYRVYRSQYDFDKWYFACQLGCAAHPKILNVKEVQFNSRVILVKNLENNEEHKWYIFYSPDGPIKCCQGNTILGPLTLEKVDEFKLKNSIERLITKVIETNKVPKEDNGRVEYLE